ncbi:MAG: kelch repeat-containing protein [Acidobacteriota bacterium]
MSFSVCFSGQAQTLSRFLFLFLVVSLALVGRGNRAVRANSLQSAGAWSFTGLMKVGRNGPTATLLRDGRVLVAGGRDANNQPLVSAELYDPATDRWTQAGNLNEARADHSAALLKDGRVLIVGYRSAEVYDPATDKWTSTAEMKIGAMSAASYNGAPVTLLADGRVLVVGGYAGLLSFAHDRAELFDPATLTWSATGALNFARYSPTATLLPDGKVLVAGGVNRLDRPTASEIYDPVTGKWAIAANIKLPRSGHTATSLPDGNVLLAGGAVSETGRETEIYNPATGTWRSGSSLNFSKTSPIAVRLASGKVLITGGHNEVYDPASGQWSVVADSILPRPGGALTALPNGKALLVGGANGESSLRSAELFDPAGSGIPGVWNLAASPGKRQTHTATALADGRVLVAGGGVYSPLSKTVTLTPGAQVFEAGKNWQDAGNLNIARQSHSATLLANGQVLVAGGESGANSSLLSAELFNPATNSWRNAAPLSLPRRQHQAVLLANGKVLIAGGANDSSELGSAEAYDPATDRWATTGAMALARRFHTLTLLADGKVLAAGGETSGAATASVELYDPATGAWHSTGALKTARRRHTATRLLNGKVLITGGAGLTSDALLASAEIYDPATGEWSSAGALNFPRQNHTATLLNDGRVLIAGGDGGDGRLNSAEIFDAAANNGAGGFSHTAPLSTQRELHTATKLADGRVLAVGGINGASSFSPPINTVAETEIFDPFLTAMPVMPLRIAPVSASSFRGGDLAAESIISIFGQHFTNTTVVANSTPLPLALGGVRVSINHLGGNFPVPLFFVSPNQINCQLFNAVTQATPRGAITLTLTTSDGVSISEPVNIVSVAPGIFSADATGKGLPAAVVLRVKTNGEQTYEPVARFDAAQSRLVAVPIDVSNANERVFLILYGTGIRFRSSLSAMSASVGGAPLEVLYAGVQGDFVGLDQINLRLPSSLAGRGEVEVQVSADGAAANVVKINMK